MSSLHGRHCVMCLWTSVDWLSGNGSCKALKIRFLKIFPKYSERLTWCVAGNPTLLASFIYISLMSRLPLVLGTESNPKSAQARLRFMHSWHGGK